MFQFFFAPVILALLVALPAQNVFAMATEVGSSYSYMKRSFSESDTIENQSITASVSLFVWEQAAIELSYTNGIFVRREKQSALAGSDIRTTTQKSDVFEANLIYVFANRQAAVQPFIKGGLGYLTKKQEVQIGNDVPFQVNPKPGIAPSYGFGVRLVISQGLSIRASYDAMKTPVDDSNTADDIGGRIGLVWTL